VVLCLKVFGRKENTSQPAGKTSHLSSPVSDVRHGNQAARSHTAGSSADAARSTIQKQKELEKLLMKAENEDISKLPGTV